MTWALVLVTLAALASTAIFVVADRAARAAAWRQIAIERRWIQEQRLSHSGHAD